ncbi:TadE family protein [Solilutibacter pythonis]|nr:TadE family protein [Lysobacter pythonis]
MHGQALTEMAVVCAVLVPLFLLIPILGKYIHMRQMTQQAARNAAWNAIAFPEYGVNAQQAGVERAMLSRSFANADAPIRSNENPPARGRFDDPLLNTFSGQPLLERDGMRVRSLTDAKSPGFASSTVSSLLGALPGAFPPNKAGYVTAEVRVNVRDLKTRDGAAARYLAPFDRLGLTMSARQSLLADPWNAGGPTQGRRSVKSQVGTLVPVSKLAGTQKVLDVIGALPLPAVGLLDGLDIGTVEPDIVPYDRLQRYPVRE